MLFFTDPKLTQPRHADQTWCGSCQWLWAVVVLVLGAASPAVVAQEPSITAELNTSRIFIGESVVYSVMVSNVQDPPEPNLANFDEFDVKLLGQQSQNSSSITIINGVRKDVRRFGKLFQYSLTPTESGTLTIPAPTVEIDGQVLTGEPLKLTVSGASDQESVFLETLVEPADQLYPTQQFDVILQIDVRSLDGELSDRSPLSIQETVKLKIPWLAADSIPNCTSESEGLDVIRPMLAAQGQQDGFGINGFSVGGRSLFSRSRAAQFVPPSEEITRKLKDGTEANFIRYTIKQTFRAERAGEIRVPAATIRGLFATPNTQPIEGQELFAVSNIATLTVSDVPTEGRPNTFCGGIGSFGLTATVTPQNAVVGDPMTLTIEVLGEGTLDLIVAPDVARMEGVKDNFRVYEPTSKSIPNGRIFTFTLRPETDAVKELPAIPFSFFDVEQGQYVTAKTDSIPLKVFKATKLDMDEVIGDNRRRPADDTAEALQQNTSTLAANHVALRAGASNWLTWKQWLLVWGLIFAATGCLRMLMTAGDNKNSDPIALRRRLAFSNAASALQAAQSTASESSSVPVDALGRIVIGLVADATGQQASGMTSTETAATLAGLGLPNEIQNETTNFLQACDAARFGASNDDQERLLKRCQDLVKTLSKELR